MFSAICGVHKNVSYFFFKRYIINELLMIHQSLFKYEDVAHLVTDGRDAMV